MKRVTVYITDPQQQAIRQLAKALGLKKAEVLRKALEIGLHALQTRNEEVSLRRDQAWRD